jgi:two-component system, NarL family, invasion response regulator UvrY
MSIRVLLADDHPVVLRGLRDLLSAEPDCTVAAEAEDAPTLQRLAREVEWDVLVLDLQMPGASGLDLLKNLASWFPRRPILVHSLHAEEQYAVRALRAGASGYVTKMAKPREFVAALRLVAAGGTYASPALAERLARDVRRPAGPAHERLSDRELEVLRGIASGKSVGDLAVELSLSVKTVSTYRARILEKLELRHNAELTRYALDHGLV